MPRMLAAFVRSLSQHPWCQTQAILLNANISPVRVTTTDELEMVTHDSATYLETANYVSFADRRACPTWYPGWRFGVPPGGVTAVYQMLHSLVKGIDAGTEPGVGRE